MTDNPLGIVMLHPRCGMPAGQCACGAETPGDAVQPFLPLNYVPEGVIEELRAEHLEVNKQQPDLINIEPEDVEEIETCDVCGDDLSAGYCESCNLTEADRADPDPRDSIWSEGWG